MVGNQVYGRDAVARIEAFSDAVFAISATLLVVSLEVPKDFDGLIHSLSGFIAFGASFAIFVSIWSHHHRYFKNFPLGDAPNVMINAVLLFLVMLFVYPLKFLMSAFTQWVTGIGEIRALEFGDLDSLFAIYGAGWVAVFLCFAALYARAAQHHAALGLTPAQRADARVEAEFALAFGSIGLFSLTLALLGTSRFYGLPGFVYGACGLVGWWYGRSWQRRVDSLVERYAASA